MAGNENIQKASGQPKNYQLDRGGAPVERGPFVGRVMNNVDPARLGRLQVYIEYFAGPNPNDPNLWRQVKYCPPFYGATPKGGSAGTGTYVQGNQQSYGMWFTPPDIGTNVLCFWVSADPNDGYYVGCIPDPGITHMIPAIGSVPTSQAQTQNANQKSYFGGAAKLPVTEINSANLNISQNPKYFDQPKPVHSYVAGVLFQQGLISDPIRGSIGSTSQRESPSNCYGISTPGRAIYQGGIGATQGGDAAINTQSLGNAQPAAATVIGRRGGHTFVMDDGDLKGNDNLIRIRTSKGHQITMSDDGNCFYICHANGQAWIEMGQEGTLDVYATNSINLRTDGTINLHADKDINMYAGGNFNLKGKGSTAIQSDGDLNVANKGKMTLFSQGSIGIKTTGSLALDSQLGSWSAKAALSLKGTVLLLNSGPGLPVSAPKGLTKYLQPNTEFNATTGWTVSATGTESICTRAPTHEPYPYHNQGVGQKTSLADGTTSSPPDAPSLPDGVTITKTDETASTLADTAIAGDTGAGNNLSSVDALGNPTGF